MFSVRSSAEFVLVLGSALFFPAVAVGQVATPVSTTTATVFTLVERPEQVTILDLGESGTSPGDLTVWGLNPLYDEANAVDTGALTHGSCMSLNTGGDNLCTETVLFADGSTLEIQGIQLGSGEPSLTTIVGGSGTYRGATGSVLVDPSADYQTWTKTFEVVMPATSSP